MGIEPYLISSSVVAVMAQRLLRVICPQCKEPFDPKANIDSLLGRNKQHTSAAEAKFYRGAGCKNCLETGYLGRTAISELLVIDDDIKKMILKRQGSHIIEEAAIKKGMLTLREDGIRKALAGETTLEEVCRVTRDSLRTDTENTNNVVS
jgi:general secretion pathway protein E